MNNLEPEESDRLIAKYLSGNVTPKEIVELETWTKESPCNLKYFTEEKNIWHTFDKSIDSSKISTEKALAIFRKKISEESKIILLWKYFQTAAAILIIPLVLGGVFWRQSKVPEKGVVAFKEVFTSNGSRLVFSLEDGTKVWLNAGSSLKYPEKFTNLQRSVFLKGEAYFEVKSDVSKPFIVNAQSISVKATGTKFNVRAYVDQKQSEVSLLYGKVAVFKAGKALISLLHPNQHLDYNSISQQVDIEKGDLYKYVAWREGKLIFRNDPLSDVLERIGEFHNVHFEIKDKKLLEYRYHITFQNESLPEILEILKASSPMDFKIMKRKPNLPDGSISKQEIIIFQKRRL